MGGISLDVHRVGALGDQAGLKLENTRAADTLFRVFYTIIDRRKEIPNKTRIEAEILYINVVFGAVRVVAQIGSAIGKMKFKVGGILTETNAVGPEVRQRYLRYL
jgi:hypothetical protein